MNLAKDFKKLLIPKGKNSDIYNKLGNISVVNKYRPNDLKR